ncbi:uncharacterized protein [Ptychodera flava]|uniref:uncharacterized protein n=1 Tax=Ptychodera flava TaxID=63121 RepID=UPI003969C601
MEKYITKFQGDKGGTTTKLCLQLANVGNCSADNIELVAMFEAYDSYDNMKQIFGMYTEQVEALQTNFSVKISDNRFQVLRAFLYGDYAFLCNVLGHQGAASKHPCLWCDIAKQQLSKGVPHCSVKLDSVTNTFIANPDWEPRVRSIAQMQNDLIQYDKKDGKKYRNITKPMLLPILDSVYQIVPMPLHILLGLVLKFYNMLETTCRQIDRNDNESLYGVWKDASDQAEQANLEYEEAKAAYQSSQELLAAFVCEQEKKGKKKRQRRRCTTEEDACNHPLCAISGVIKQMLKL